MKDSALQLGMLKDQMELDYKHKVAQLKRDHEHEQEQLEHEHRQQILEYENIFNQVRITW